MADQKVNSALQAAVEEFNPNPTTAYQRLQAEKIPKAVRMGVNMGAGTALVTSDDTMREALGSVMTDLQRPEFDAAYRHIIGGVDLPTLAQGQTSVPAEGDDSTALFKALAVESGADGAESIAKTMAILQKLSFEADNMGAGGLPGPGLSSDSAAAAEGMSDELINRMMKEFETMGRKDDFSAVVDNMMRQLLSKDIMYLPMKAICEEFPEWLAVHGARLDNEKYQAYGRMYQIFQKMVDTYETQPDNFPRLLELMQDMQECGNPPPEILAKLAPGLQLSPDGLPAMMPNMGAGLPQMPGIPTAGGQCSIM